MKKGRKTQDWHVIVVVNEKQKDKVKYPSSLKVGNCVTHNYPCNHAPQFMNIKTGEEYWIYDIRFLGKLPIGMNGDELSNNIKALAKKKGYLHLIEQREKGREKND